MKVSCFPNLQDAQGYLDEVASVGELIAAPVASSRKESVRLYSPAQFEGNYRKKDNARCVHFAVLDIDHAQPDARDRLIAHLVAHGYEFAFHTSWSHDPEAGEYNFRVAVPFAAPVPVDNWSTEHWPRIVAALCPPGIETDPACKDASRAYFEPSFHPARKHSYESLHNPGRALDLGVRAPSVVYKAPAQGGAPPVGGTLLRSVEHLKILEKRCARRQTEVAQEAAVFLRHVRKGEAWGDPLTRNTRLSSACFEMVQEWPDLDPDQVSQLFTASCLMVQKQGPDAAKYTPTYVAAKLREKFKYVAERQAQYAKQQHEDFLQQLEEHGFDRPYDPGEIIDLHRTEVHPHGWLLQTDNGAYIRTPKAGYRFFKGISAAKNAAHLNLMPARPYGIKTTRFDKDGIERVLPLDELVLHHGDVPNEIRGSLVAQETRWSRATRTLTIAECPVRPLTPRFSASIDAWLKLLGADKYEDLCRWMAWATHLHHACVMLVMAGPTGCGKSLLARGLARLWTLAEPTALSDALDAFNAGLARCPLLFADEHVPRGRDGRHRFDDLRELVSKKYFSINEKNVPKRDVEGAVRIIVAINDLSLLVGDTPESTDELKATLERILHITPSPETPAYLEALREAGAYWNDDAIAEHALFLRQVYPLPANPPRFLFEPKEQAVLANAFVSSSAMFGAICSWLISFLREPRKLYAEVSSVHDAAWRVRVTANGIYATANAIQHHWSKYEEKRPYHRAVRQAFFGLKKTRSSVITPIGPAHSDLIDFERLVAYAEDNALAEREELIGLIDEYLRDDVYTHAEHAVRQRMEMRDDATNIAHFRKKG